MVTETQHAAREWPVEELRRRLDRGDDLFILDVRSPEEVKRWRLEGRRPVALLNVPYAEMLAGDADDLAEAAARYAQDRLANQLPKDRPIGVVCAKGGASAFVAEGLRRQGYEAYSVRGGMAAWGDYYEFKPVAQEVGLSIWQVIRPARGCLSYVLASGGEAVVVDPLRHWQRYREFAREQGLRIVAVLDTHAHADHISGGRHLAGAEGVPYYLHPYDGIHPVDVLPATFDYQYLRDGQVLAFGAARLQVIHIPGHTLGNTAFLVNQQYLCTGDSIFVASIARPDLGGRGDTWAPLHWESLRRLLGLPDEVLVLPGHYARPDEAGDDGLFARSLGELRHTNDGLRKVQEGKEAFVRWILANLPTFPPEYVDIKRVNAGLLEPDEEQAAELELGRNICALAQAYTGET